MAHRILYIPSASAIIRGSAKDLLNILENIDRSTFEPVVLSPDKGDLFCKLRGLKIRSKILKLPSWRKLKGIPFWIPRVYQLYKFVKSERIDIIHVNDFWFAPFGILVSRAAAIPCIINIREYNDQKKIKQYQVPKANRLIAKSKGIKKMLIDFGLPKDRIVTILSGIDLDSIPGYSNNGPTGVRLPSDSCIVGTVANVTPVKGLEYFIDALKLIMGKKDSVRGMIVGDFSVEEPYYRSLISRIERYDLSDRFIFTGFKSNVFPYISLMDVFVLSSISEALGLVLLEAMAMEKPIVAFRVGGIPEVVKDGESGILIEPNDVQAMADAILYLLSNKEVAYKMGGAGQRIVREKFSLQREITQLEEVYGELLALRVSK